MTGPYAREVFDGSLTRQTFVTDLFCVRDTQVSVTDVEDTPDLNPGPWPSTPAGSRIAEGAPRFMLDLDQGWISQTARRPKKPMAVDRVTESFLDETEPVEAARPEEEKRLGLNKSKIGAFARLQDVFRISIAESKASGDATTGGAPKVHNDRFGSSTRIPSPEEAETPLLFMGRLEIRTAVHFYRDDRRTGQLNFVGRPSPTIEKLDSPDGKTARLLLLDDDTLTAPEGKLRGELFPGDLRFEHRILRSWLPVAGVLEAPCDNKNDKVKPAFATIDLRRTFVDAHTCSTLPDGPILDQFCFRASTLDDGDSPCPTISCAEVGNLSFQERFVMHTDRINCALHEIDRLWCAIKGVIECLREAKKAVGGDPKVACDHCLDF